MVQIGLLFPILQTPYSRVLETLPQVVTKSYGTLKFIIMYKTY